MRRIFLKIFIILVPFIIIDVFLLTMDPYNLFNVSHFVDDNVKYDCINRSNESIPRGNILWKAIRFRKEPSKNIILGDSRVANISEESLSKIYNSRCSNLAVAGGNYGAVIELFWMAVRYIELDNVIIQANFNTYSVEGCQSKLYEPTKKVLEDNMFYFFEWDYVKDAIALFYYFVSNDKEFVSRGFQRTENNWAKSAKALAYHYNLNNYRYPESLRDELEDIAVFCDSNNIDLTFVIAPNYFEVLDYIDSSGISKEYQRFKLDIKNIQGAEVIDLDVRSPFSYDKNNYADHYHVKMERADTLLHLISKDLKIKN